MTDLALARRWTPRPTRLISIAPTKFSNAPVARAAKRSEGKATWPGRKQVFRACGDDGHFSFDTLALEDQKPPATLLLVPVMRNGQPLETPTPLIELRQRVTQEVARLPEELKKPEPAQAYPVDISPGLRALAAELDRASN